MCGVHVCNESAELCQRDALAMGPDKETGHESSGQQQKEQVKSPIAVSGMYVWNVQVTTFLFPLLFCLCLFLAICAYSGGKVVPFLRYKLSCSQTLRISQLGISRFY